MTDEQWEIWCLVKHRMERGLSQDAAIDAVLRTHDFTLSQVMDAVETRESDRLATINQGYYGRMNLAKLRKKVLATQGPAFLELDS